MLPITAARIPAEILAGITLAAIAIPEVMGYTKIAGMPVITGLYTMLIPMALFALFGSSRHLVVGADSATAAILAAGLVGLAAIGSEQYLALAGVLALMAAVFLILARVMRLGFLADFLSRTVLIGFLTGVGIQVALGQIAGMLGLQGGGHGTLGKLWNDLQQLGQVNRYELTIALAVLVVIVGLKKISKKIPGGLIAVIGAMVASWAFGLDTARCTCSGPFRAVCHTWVCPRWTGTGKSSRHLIPTAFAMFVVILAQSAATSRAYATRYDERFSENTDLVGLALANIGAGLSGTFVVNGSPTKTQIVDSAGGRSQLSLLAMAAIVLLVLLFLTAPLAFMPEAALSAIVFLIGVDLIDIAGMRKVFAQRRSEFWVALITALTVVFVGVEQGILLAIVLSLVDHTRHGYRPKNAVLVPGESGGRQPKPVATAAQAVPGLVIYRFTHSLYYANCQQLSDEVSLLANTTEPPRALALPRRVRGGRCRLLGGGNPPVGSREVEGERHTPGRCGGHGGPQDPDRYRFQELFGEDAFYDHLEDVVKQYRQQFNFPVPSKRSDPTPGGVDRGT